MKFEHKKVVGIVYRPKELRKVGSFMYKLKLKVKRTFLAQYLLASIKHCLASSRGSANDKRRNIYKNNETNIAHKSRF